MCVYVCVTCVCVSVYIRARVCVFVCDYCLCVLFPITLFLSDFNSAIHKCTYLKIETSNTKGACLPCQFSLGAFSSLEVPEGKLFQEDNIGFSLAYFL